MANVGPTGLAAPARTATLTGRSGDETILWRGRFIEAAKAILAQFIGVPQNIRERATPRWALTTRRSHQLEGGQSLAAA
jgi:hypothetical protein